MTYADACDEVALLCICTLKEGPSGRIPYDQRRCLRQSRTVMHLYLIGGKNGRHTIYAAGHRTC